LKLRSGHWVYLARCADGSFYCGYARDPVARVAAHNRGAGAKILRGKLPVRLAYARRLSSKERALSAEAALKSRSHADKHALAKQWDAKRRE
jgi:putative endonuclease